MSVNSTNDAIIENNSAMEHPSLWKDNSISLLTVSLPEKYDRSTSQISELKNEPMLARCCHHLLTFAMLLCSASLVVVPLIMLRINGPFSKRVENALHLLIYIGTFSFSGCSATCISILFVFLPAKCYFMRQSTKVINSRTRVIERIFGEIFQEKFVSQYMKRDAGVKDVENSQTLLSFLESTEFNDWLQEEFESLVYTTQGLLLLDSIGLIEEEAFSQFKLFIVKTITVFPEKLSDLWNNELHRRHSFSNHIRKIMKEQLTCIPSSRVSSMISEYIIMQIDCVCFVAMVTTAAFGSLIGYLFIYT